MKEKILEVLANLGFKTEAADEMGYVFEYEGMRLLYIPNDDDEDFLVIALPGFYDYDEEKIGPYVALSEKLNSTLKYVKAYTIANSMWLFYERELFGGENLEEIISRMVLRLEAGLMVARDTIKEMEASFDNDNDANGDDTADGNITGPTDGDSTVDDNK